MRLFSYRKTKKNRMVHVT